MRTTHEPSLIFRNLLFVHVSFEGRTLGERFLAFLTLIRPIIHSVDLPKYNGVTLR